MAQGGLWDIDGSGLQRIEDDSIASAILRKTNTMNFQIGAKAIVITAVLTTLPEAAKLVGNGWT